MTEEKGSSRRNMKEGKDFLLLKYEAGEGLFLINVKLWLKVSSCWSMK
jgi:hypothetical protein